MQQAQQIETRFEVNEDETTQLQTTVTVLKVHDDGSLGKAAALVKQIRERVAYTEQQRKHFVGPANETVRRINAKAKAITAPLLELKRAIEQKMVLYQIERRREQKRIEREREDKILAAAVKVEEEGAPEVADALVEQAAKEPPRSQVVHAPRATVSVRKIWTFQVQDISKVPAEYLSLDTGKVRNAIRAGKREIPGLRIFQSEQSLVR